MIILVVVATLVTTVKGGYCSISKVRVIVLIRERSVLKVEGRMC